MLRTLLILILSCAMSALAQPLQGPFTVLEGPAFARLSDPHIAMRNADTADVFYQVSGTIYHIPIALADGHVFGEPQAFPTNSDGWTRRVCDAISMDSGWAALVYDTTELSNRTMLFEGRDTLRTFSAIDSGWFGDGSQWNPRSANYGLILARRSAGGCFAAWQNAWMVYFGTPPFGWSEGGSGIILHVAADNWPYQPDLNDGFGGCAENEGATVVHAVTDDSLIILESGTHCIRARVAISSEGNGFMFHDPNYAGCSLRIAGALFTPGGRVFVLSHSTDDGESPRLVELQDLSTCVPRLSFDSNPLTSVSDPNRGIAWLSGDVRGLYVTRADTSGALHLPAGLLFEPQGGFSAGEATLAATDNGMLAALWVEHSTIDSSRDQLRMATFGWDTPLGAISPKLIPHPASFVLSSAPNPFNSSTRILFDLPERMDVHLAVFDVTGRLVRTLSDGVMQSGAKEVEWNGRDDRGIAVVTGVYFCRLTSEHVRATRKLLLIR